MNADDAHDFLRVHQSTRGLTDEQVCEIARQAEVIRCEEGAELHAPDQRVEALFLIMSGRLRFTISGVDGHERTVHISGRDTEFGLLAINQDEPFALRVIAEQHAVLLRIPAEPALELLSKFPLWSRNLMNAMGLQLRDSLIPGKRGNRPRFVAMIHVTNRSRHLTATLVEQLMSLGERVGLLTDQSQTPGVEPSWLSSLIDTQGRQREPDDIRRQVGDWSAADRVILDAEIKHAESHLAELMSASEAAYWICESDSVRLVEQSLKPLVTNSPGLKDKMFVIQVLNDDEPVAPLDPNLSSVCHRDFKLHPNGYGTDSPVRTRSAGLRRLIHHLRGISIGLALGGGAARGMAHLGVLQVLEENGIPIDLMAGTSAGALTGVLYAAGYSAEFLVNQFATDLKPSWYYNVLPYGDAFYVLRKFRRGGWDRMLRKYLGRAQLQQLALPVSSVAVDLVSAKTVIHSQGDAVQAILDSINLPGVARPICRDGQALVDGGVFNIVPADVLVEQGANLVIASNVSSSIAFEFSGNRPDTPTEHMKVPGTVATITRMRRVQDRNLCTIGGTSADIVIDPDVSQVELTDFKSAAAIADLGRIAAEESLPEIRNVLRSMAPELYRD